MKRFVSILKDMPELFDGAGRNLSILFLDDGRWTGSLAVLILITILAIRLYPRIRAGAERTLKPYLRIWLHLAEMLVLLVLACAVAAFSPGVSENLSSVLQMKGDQAIWLKSMAAHGDFVVVAMGLLALTRFTANRGVCLTLAVLWLCGWFGMRWAASGYPEMLADIAAEQESPVVPDVFLGRIWLPKFVVSLRKLCEALLPFLFAIYCSRIRFSRATFAMSCVVGTLVIGGLFYGRAILSGEGAGLVTAILLFNSAAVLLPLQRSSFERLWGISLRYDSTAPPAPSCQWSARFGAHATLAALCLLAVSFVPFGFIERDLFAMLRSGSKPVYHSPAMRNGYDDLKDYFLRYQSVELKTSYPRREDDEFHTSIESSSNVTPALIDEGFHLIDADYIDSRHWELKPYIDALARGMTADYCYFYEEDFHAVPNFINLRTVAQLLSAHANLCMWRNEPDQALEDIRILFGAGWLLMDEPNSLVSLMIGVAVKGIGVATTRQFFFRCREEPAQLIKLENLLKEMRPKAQSPWDMENLKRVEPGFRPVVPYFELIVPGVVRAADTSNRRWAMYDQLLLACILERFRTEQGAYPESLGELVPVYLDRELLDPYEGKPYFYRARDDYFELDAFWLRANDDKVLADFWLFGENDRYEKWLRTRQSMKQDEAGQ